MLGNDTLLVGPVGTIAMNKTMVDNNTLSVPTGSTLTITNSSGFGLSLGGTVTLPSSQAATISVANATNSNSVQGLTISGTLSGGVTGSGNVVFTKSGVGTLELASTNDTFGGSGSIINVTQGVLAATSDAALGDSSNVIDLNPSTGTSTFAALGTFATSRTIEFGTTSNTRSIAVTSGNKLTLNSPFGFSLAPGAALTKNDAGTLVFGSSVNNSGWTGTLAISQGAVELASATNLSSTTTVSAVTSGGALQLNNAHAGQQYHDRQFGHRPGGSTGRRQRHHQHHGRLDYGQQW